MKRFEIRTKDQILKRALECWWTEAEPRLPEATVVVLTDLDSVPPSGGEEITLSRTLPCNLPRPFDYEQLEELIMGRPRDRGARLIFKEGVAYLDSQPLSLSPLEFRLLSLLAERSQDQPASAAWLSLALWGEERTSNQINVYIRYLRQKTDLPGRERLIYTQKGRGFYLKNER